MKVNIDQFNEKESDNVCEVEVASKDCWSLDYVLAQVIHPALVKFRSDLHSSARVDNEDVPEALRISPEKEETQSWMSRWEYVLDEMIWGFNQIASSEADEPQTYGKPDWDAYHKRLDNATRLFGKYYRNLWN